MCRPGDRNPWHRYPGDIAACCYEVPSGGKFLGARNHAVSCGCVVRSGDVGVAGEQAPLRGSCLSGADCDEDQTGNHPHPEVVAPLGGATRYHGRYHEWGCCCCYEAADCCQGDYVVTVLLAPGICLYGNRLSWLVTLADLVAPPGQVTILAAQLIVAGRPVTADFAVAVVAVVVGTQQHSAVEEAAVAVEGWAVVALVVAVKLKEQQQDLAAAVKVQQQSEEYQPCPCCLVSRYLKHLEVPLGRLALVVDLPAAVAGVAAAVVVVVAGVVVVVETVLHHCRCHGN